MTNTTQYDIAETVKQTISELISLKEGEYSTTESFDDLGMDSIDHVEVIMAAEETFKIEISDDAAEKMQTPQDLIDFIVQALGI